MAWIDTNLLVSIHLTSDLSLTLSLSLSLFKSTAPTEAPQGLADSSATDTSEQSHADQLKQDQADIQEVVDLHEAGFAVRIQAPGTETFELQVNRH